MYTLSNFWMAFAKRLCHDRQISFVIFAGGLLNKDVLRTRFRFVAHRVDPSKDQRMPPGRNLPLALRLIDGCSKLRAATNMRGIFAYACKPSFI